MVTFLRLNRPHHSIPTPGKSKNKANNFNMQMSHVQADLKMANDKCSGQHVRLAVRVAVASRLKSRERACSMLQQWWAAEPTKS